MAVAPVPHDCPRRRDGVDEVGLSVPPANLAVRPGPDGDGVRCDIGDKQWELPPKAADCQFDWGNSLYLTEEQSGFRPRPRCVSCHPCMSHGDSPALMGQCGTGLVRAGGCVPCGSNGRGAALSRCERCGPGRSLWRLLSQSGSVLQGSAPNRASEKNPSHADGHCEQNACILDVEAERECGPGEEGDSNPCGWRPLAQQGQAGE